MNLHRIGAVVLRHLYYFPRNWDRLTDAIYWPVLDLVLWGLTTQWIQQTPSVHSHALLAVLTGIVFWQILWRANYEVSINMLEESWTGNLVNLFASPLTTLEWVLGVMCLGIIKMFLSIIVGFGAAYLLYAANIMTVGYMLLPFLSILTIFGWTIGLIATGLILRYGRKIQSVAWTFGWIFAPLSAIYYPVAALPGWAQTVSLALPTSYVFEGMRAVLASGRVPLDSLLISLGLSIVYLLLAGWFFVSMFEKRRERGLGQLD